MCTDSNRAYEMSSKDYIVVFVTAPIDKASGLAQAVVENGLVACVNIIPTVRSIYQWKGKICDDQESLLVMKTRAEQFEALCAKVTSLHPYEVPEVIAMPLVNGHVPYLEWIDETVSK